MSVVSLRYAHAFADVVRSGNLDPATAQQQLRDFAGTLAESEALRQFLSNPSIAATDKLSILDTVAGRIGVYPQVRNLIAVMMDHERLHDLPEIVAEYETLVDEQASISEAYITSARPLDPADRDELEARLGTLAGGSVRTTYQEDPALLGGAIVRLGSTVYDGSVRGQLDRLKQRLVNA